MARVVHSVDIPRNASKRVVQEFLVAHPDIPDDAQIGCDEDGIVGFYWEEIVPDPKPVFAEDYTPL